MIHCTPYGGHFCTLSYQSGTRPSTHAMSTFARRIYYLSAFLVFAIVAPLVVAWTAGYRWSNVRHGFQQTGAITITSEPKSNVVMNGETVGTTPYRATHLPAGSYSIQLTKSGYGTWQRDIAVQKNSAVTIGPVRLFPEQFTAAPYTLNDQSVLATEHFSAIYGITPATSSWNVRRQWPTRSTIESVLPFQPTSVVHSISGQNEIFSSNTQSVMILKHRPTDPWTLGQVTDVQFDPVNDNVAFARQGESLIRFDGLTATQESIAISSSFTLRNETVWFTQTKDNQTTILQQPSFGTHIPEIVLEVAGTWTFVDAPSGTLLLRNAESRILTTLDQRFTGGPWTPTELGAADRWWWTDTRQAPIWINGSDLFSLDEKKNPLLLDRLTETPISVAWIDPNHLISLVTEHEISVRSVSARQGRGTLVSTEYTSPVRLVGSDIASRELIIQTSADPLTLQQISW